MMKSKLAKSLDLQKSMDENQQTPKHGVYVNFVHQSKLNQKHMVLDTENPPISTIRDVETKMTHINLMSRSVSS